MPETVVTDADLRGFRADFFTVVDIGDAQLRAALAADPRWLHLARQWGWADSEVRDGLAAHLQRLGYTVDG